MGIKRKMKNYIYLKNHYSLYDKVIIPDNKRQSILIIEYQIPTFDKDFASNRIQVRSKTLQCLFDGLAQINP